MKSFRLLMVGMAIVASHHIQGQSISDLLGKWTADYEMDGEEFSIVYEFQSKEGKTLCYARSMTNDEGQSVSINTLAMNNITFTNSNGTANYMIDYDDEKYEVEADLELTSKDRLEVSYFYWGFGDDEVWIKKE